MLPSGAAGSARLWSNAACACAGDAGPRARKPFGDRFLNPALNPADTASAEATLIALSPSALSREASVASGGLVLGRDAAQVGLVVSAAGVSRRHCRVYATADGQWRVRDLDSTNGVFLDGCRIDGDAPIASGQALGLGRSRVPDFLFYPPGERGRSQDRILPAAAVWRIGRSLQAELSLPGDGAISLEHAEVHAAAHGLELRDTDSRNGTWLDGQRIGRARVYPDSVVTLGHTRLRLELLVDGRLAVHLIGASGGRELQAIRLEDRRAGLRDVSLVLEPGQLTGLLAVDAAAPRALLQLLAGLRRPDQGQVLIDDVPLHGRFEQFRSNIGYVSIETSVDSALRLDRALDSTARLRLPADLGDEGRAAIVEATLAALTLEPHRRNRIRRLSPELQRRAAIAVELVTRPGILLLDRPTDGLDSEAAARIHGVLQRMAYAGRTVVVAEGTTDKPERFDRIAWLPHGRLCFIGAPDEAVDILTAPERGAAACDAVAHRFRQSEAFRLQVTQRAGRLGRSLLDAGQVPEPGARSRRADAPEPVPRWSLLPTLIARQVSARVARRSSLFELLLLPLLLATGMYLATPLEVATATSLPTVSLWLLAIAAALFGGLAGAAELPGRIELIRRERLIGVHPLLAILARWPAAAGLALLQCAVLLLMAQAAGESSGIDPWRAAGPMAGVALASVAVGLAAGAADSGRGVLARSVVLVVSMLPALLLGLWPGQGAGPPGLAWIADLLPARWGMEMLLSAMSVSTDWATAAAIQAEQAGWLYGAGVHVRGALVLGLIALCSLGLATLLLARAARLR